MMHDILKIVWEEEHMPEEWKKSDIIPIYKQRYGIQVLQCRYCNTSGSLTPLPCRVVNHCIVVQVLVRTEG